MAADYLLLLVGGKDLKIVSSCWLLVVRLINVWYSKTIILLKSKLILAGYLKVSNSSSFNRNKVNFKFYAKGSWGILLPYTLYAVV